MYKYGKIKKESQLGQKISQLIDKWIEFDKLRIDFMKMYNIRRTFRSSRYLFAVCAVEFERRPSDLSSNWKKYASIREAFTLRTKPADKQLRNYWTELVNKSVKRCELDCLIGEKNPYVMDGWILDMPDYYYVEASNNAKFPLDCEEITNIEYRNIENL